MPITSSVGACSSLGGVAIHSSITSNRTSRRFHDLKRDYDNVNERFSNYTKLYDHTVEWKVKDLENLLKVYVDEKIDPKTGIRAQDNQKHRNSFWSLHLRINNLWREVSNIEKRLNKGGIADLPESEKRTQLKRKVR